MDDIQSVHLGEVSRKKFNGREREVMPFVGLADNDGEPLMGIGFVDGSSKHNIFFGTPQPFDPVTAFRAVYFAEALPEVSEDSVALCVSVAKRPINGDPRPLESKLDALIGTRRRFTLSNKQLPDMSDALWSLRALGVAVDTDSIYTELHAGGMPIAPVDNVQLFGILQDHSDKALITRGLCNVYAEAISYFTDHDTGLRGVLQQLKPATKHSDALRKYAIDAKKMFGSYDGFADRCYEFADRAANESEISINRNIKRPRGNTGYIALFCNNIIEGCNWANQLTRQPPRSDKERALGFHNVLHVTTHSLRNLMDIYHNGERAHDSIEQIAHDSQMYEEAAYLLRDLNRMVQNQMTDEYSLDPRIRETISCI